MRPTIRLSAASDTGSSDTDRVTRDAAPHLFGLADPFSLISIFDGGILIGRTSTPANGTWSFTARGLSDGLHSLTVRSAGLGGIEQVSTILPVTIVAEPAAEDSDLASSGQMEIVLADGDRIIVWADVDTAALTRVLKALARR